MNSAAKSVQPTPRAVQYQKTLSKRGAYHRLREPSTSAPAPVAAPPDAEAVRVWLCGSSRTTKKEASKSAEKLGMSVQKPRSGLKGSELNWKYSPSSTKTTASLFTGWHCARSLAGRSASPALGIAVAAWHAQKQYHETRGTPAETAQKVLAVRCSRMSAAAERDATLTHTITRSTASRRLSAPCTR